MNVAQNFPPLSVSSLLSSSHSYTHIPSAGAHVSPLWIRVGVCVNFCIHYHNYIYKSQLIFFSLTHFLSFFFSNREIEKLISVLLWCRRGIHKRKLLSLVSEDMREKEHLCGRCRAALFFSTPSHALTHACADPVLIFYGVKPHQHSV